MHNTDTSFPQAAGAQVPGMSREGDWGREAEVMVTSQALDEFHLSS